MLLQSGRVLTNRTRHINLTQKSEKNTHIPNNICSKKDSLSFFQTTLNVACWEHNMTWSGHSWHLIYFQHLRPRVYPSDPYRWWYQASDPPKNMANQPIYPPTPPPKPTPRQNERPYDQGLWTIMVSLNKAGYFWGVVHVRDRLMSHNPFDKQDTGVTDLAGLHTFS